MTSRVGRTAGALRSRPIGNLASNPSTAVPVWLIVPTEAVPVVQALPVTVRLTKPCTAIGEPPRPMPFMPPVVKGTTRFAGGGVEQGAKSHTFERPWTGIVPTPLPSASNEKLPTPFVASSTETPMIGKAAESVTGITPEKLKMPAVRFEIEVPVTSAEPVSL